MRKIFVLAIIIMFSFCACGEGRNYYDEELSEEVVIKENYLQDLGEYINGFTNESESSIDLEERDYRNGFGNVFFRIIIVELYIMKYTIMI